MMRERWLLLMTVFGISFAAPAQRDDLFELPIIHFNDFHARFEETSAAATECHSDDCIGGFSRLYTAIMQNKNARPDSLVLNAGDNFQGTLWYTVHRWNVTQYFLNMLPQDAVTLGNHEFDNDIPGVVPFLEHLQAPVVVSNIDDSEEPTIQGLYSKSTVVVRGEKRIGIIGAILHSTNEISSTGRLGFLNETESINAEAERLLAEENVDIIIVLSHCGLDVDQQIAAGLIPKVNLIVGGHSHTFLYSGDPPGPDVPAGPYPVIVERENGRNVLIVQASSYCRYLGLLTVRYDADGNIVEWEGNPIYLDQSVEQDPQINEELLPWKVDVDAIGLQVIGSTKVLLDDGCYDAECNIGDFLTDAMVDAHVDRAENGSWTYASIAFTNAGSVRTPILEGDITYGDLLVCQPFQNTVDTGELTGQNIWDIINFSLDPDVRQRYWARNTLLMSGVHVTYDYDAAPGSKIKEITVRCRECRVPQYEPLDLGKTYRVILVSFLVTGGDGFSLIADNLQNHVVGELDSDVFVRYIQKMSPISQEIDQRIRIFNPVASTPNGTSTAALNFLLLVLAYLFYLNN